MCGAPTSACSRRSTRRRPARATTRETVRKYNDHALIIESIHQPRCFIPLDEWYENIGSEGIDVREMAGKRVVAVSAIGNPASFEQTLSDLGAVIIESLRYPDHHDYAEREMRDVLEQAEAKGAEAIVITEKDAVKIPTAVVRAKWPIPVYVICVEVTFQSGHAAFHALLEKKLAAARGEKLSTARAEKEG